MYQSILVPLDGSPAAEHALPWALSLAKQGGSTVHLVRVHVGAVPLMVGSELATDVVLDDALRTAETSYLKSVVERLSAASTIAVHHSLIEGAPIDAIQDHAKSLKNDLIVMTTHGRGAFARFWLGSVADKVVRNSTVPTLLVRPTEQAADLNDRPFVQRIVIPLDGSELAERAIEPAIKLGKTMGAEYSLILVLDAVEDIEAIARLKIHAAGAWHPEATLAKAHVYLDRVAHRMHGHSLIVHTKVIQHGSAAGTILEYAQTHGNPIIALATHGRSGLKRMFMGSVADKVVRGATMPVLVYHPAEAS